VVVDPRATATSDPADLHLAIRPGTDLVLLQGIGHLLLELQALDQRFIAAHTEGFAELKEVWQQWTPQRVSDLCGIAEADLRQLARWWAEAASVLSLWSMGVNQSSEGTATVAGIINLHLATAQIGRAGAHWVTILGVALSCAFVDKRGSLSAITNTLASHGINILGLSAFSTDTGIAIDTFEVDRFDESAAMSLIACMDGLYFFSSNLPTPRMLVSPSLSPSSSPSASLRGGDSFVEHMSELSRSARPRQTERGSAVAAHRFTSLLRNLAIGSSNSSARHTAR
jgi:hypothetical protein